MTQQEFRKTYLNLEVTALVRMNFHPAKFVTNVESPDELNFIEQGYLKVSNIKKDAVHAMLLLLLLILKIYTLLNLEKIKNSQNK